MATASSTLSKTPSLEEPKPGGLTIHYGPANGVAVVEKPPSFPWLPVIEDEARYILRVSADPKFPAKTTRTFTGIPLNFFTPDETFEPGQYHWSYAVLDPATGKPATTWSTPSCVRRAASRAKRRCSLWK